MISSLTGRLLAKTPDRVEIGVGGVGFRLLVPRSTFVALPEVGSEVTLSTSLQVRENAIDLIGFATQTEREIFELLIQVSGVGTKLALSVISRVRLEDLLCSIIDEDRALLATIPGIGPKTAGRLVLELKEKVAKIVSLRQLAAGGKPSHVEEAVLALEALGYTRYEAKRAVEMTLKEIGSNHSVDLIIKEALKTKAR